MVAPAASGVALTADPVNGDRSTAVITAVRGVGDRLVSGNALGDEWVIRGREATARRQPEQALDKRQALAVAREAQRIATARGTPQDIEKKPTTPPSRTTVRQPISHQAWSLEPMMVTRPQSR